VIPKIWISDETPPRALFVKGTSGVDPDCLVAYADGSDEVLWIVFDGDFKFASDSYYVCGNGRNFRARPVRNDPTSALVGSAMNGRVGGVKEP
jgi:hypothetical protein